MDPQNIIVGPQFVVFACGPPEILHGPLGSMWTPVENHWARAKWLLFKVRYEDRLISSPKTQTAISVQAKAYYYDMLVKHLYYCTPLMH